MKILVIRFSAIGDCVMTAWPVTSIRHRHPEAEICWATQKTPIPVIDRELLVNDIAEFPRERWRRSRWLPATWREQVVAYTRLRKLKFDLGIDFHGHSKTALCLRLASPKVRISVAGTDLLSRSLNPTSRREPRSVHAIDRFYAVLEEIGDFPRVERPIMPCTPEVTSYVGVQKFVSIQTGANKPDRVYPAESWDAVAKELQSKGYKVVSVGAPGDPHLSQPGVLDCVGRLSLSECMGVVRGSALHLAGDTGTGHIAAAYGVPVVTIFGRTPDIVDKFHPWTNRCRRLYRGVTASAVPPEEVIQAAIELLEECEQAVPH